MKITDVKVYWYNDCMNQARLEVFIEEYMNDDFIYEKRGSCYFGIDKESGLCKFYYHDQKDHSGFYGSSFIVNMSSGEQETLVGPWSSRSGVMNHEGFPFSTEVLCRAKYNYSCSILNDKAIELIDKYLPGLEYYIAEDGRIFIPKHQKLNIQGYKWDEKRPASFSIEKGIENY